MVCVAVRQESQYRPPIVNAIVPTCISQLLSSFYYQPVTLKVLFLFSFISDLVAASLLNLSLHIVLSYIIDTYRTCLPTCPAYNYSENNFLQPLYYASNTQGSGHN